MKIILIIPCHNEEAALPLFYAEVIPVLDSIKDNYQCELLFVNDGSSDKTI